MRFHAALARHGRTSTVIAVPPAVADALGADGRAPVVVTINGHTWRTTIAPREGAFLLGVSAAHRQAAGAVAGDELVVHVVADDGPRTAPVPDDLAAALADAGLRERFDALPLSHRIQHVRAIDDAKTDATRARRIAKAVEMLRAG